MISVDAAFMMAHPAHGLALVGGLGLAPKAPGTVGALAGIPLGLLLALLPPMAAALLVVAGFALGVWACGVTARHAGVHDHGAIVIDETWATAAVIAFAPPGWLAVLIGFAAFRLFDIAKPWPVGLIDRTVPGGLGIMLDDAAAALYAGLVLVLMRWMGWL